MSTAAVEPGVYRDATGHTLVINEHQPKEIGAPPGYVRLGTEEEFAEGRFHPYALPGEEPEGWTPEGAGHGGADVLASSKLVLDDLPDDVKAELVDQVKADLNVDAIVAAAVKKATDAAAAKQSTAIDAAVKKAVEDATK